MAEKKNAMQSNENTLKVTFRFRNSTPGAHRYEEVNSEGDAVKQADAVIGQLYLRKAAVGAEPVKFLTVEIKAQD